MLIRRMMKCILQKPLLKGAIDIFVKIMDHHRKIENIWVKKNTNTHGHAWF